MARNTEPTETANARVRNSSSGTIGSAARDSIHTNAPSTSAPIRIRPPTVRSVQSADCLLVRPMRIGTSAPVNSAAPR